MADVDVGHFAYPFSLSAAGAQVVEQDSVEEVFGCVEAIVACEVGRRVDLPAFGIPSLEFANAPINTAGIQNAIARWEPRADTTITEYADPANPTGASRKIHLDVSVEE